MFWIPKKKVFWKDLWKDGCIDIHNHLLWGIDDGSKSFEETIALSKGLQELGITKAIATPHTYPGLWNNTATDINNIYTTYKNLESNHFIIGVGSEYLAESYLEQEVQQKSILTLPGNYILIEFSMLFPPTERIMESLFQLKLKGYQLILAHPERYLYWENSLHTFEELKTFNLHFQLNTLSLLGYYGNDVKKLAIQLLNLEFYDFFGTDTHKIEQIDYHTKKALELNNKQILILENIINANKEFSIF